MNKLDAYKMDGLGNDFIIFDKRKKFIFLTKDQIIKISDRSNIGCDQVIFVDTDKSNNVYLTFFNSDGSEIKACGNGSRCAAYLLMKGFKLLRANILSSGKYNFEFEDPTQIGHQLSIEFLNSDFSKFDNQMRNLRKIISKS